MITYEHNQDVKSSLVFLGATWHHYQDPDEEDL